MIDGRRFMRWSAIALATMVPTIVAGERPRVSPELRHARGGERINVIVQFGSEDGAERGWKRKAGPRMRRALAEGASAAYEVTPDELAELEANPDVVYVTPDREVRASAQPNAAVLDYMYEASNADRLRGRRYTGKGVGVALIDSGVFPHNDLKGSDFGNSQIVYEENFVDGDHDAKDGYGHGTHVGNPRRQR